MRTIGSRTMRMAAILIGSLGQLAAAWELPVADARLWLECENGEGTAYTLGTGNQIATWLDQSTNGFDMTGWHTPGQTNPLLVSVSALNDRKAVRFDGEGAFTAAETIFDTGHATFFVVLKGASGNLYILDTTANSIGGAMTHRYCYLFNNKVYFLRESAGNIGSAAFTTGDYVLSVGVMNGAASFVDLNGMNRATGTITNDSTACGPKVNVGSACSSGARYSGDIAEIIVYTRALSAAEINRVGYYLTRKYGVNALYSEGGFALPVGNARLWLECDNGPGTAFTLGSGNNVAIWKDQSGNGSDVAKVFGAGVPKLVSAAALANRHAVYFDGELGLRGDGPLFDTGYATAFAVFEGTNKDYYVFDTTTNAVSGGAATRRFMRLTSASMLRFGRDGSGGYLDGTLPPLGTYALSAAAINGAASFVEINGSNQVTGTVSTDATASGSYFYVGMGNNYGARFKGNLVELIVYTRALTAGQVNNVGYYLETKYGLDTGYVHVPKGTLMVVR